MFLICWWQRRCPNQQETNKYLYDPLSPSVLTAVDIGCGSGAWCVEVAERYPSAIVVGMDLSPIQPTLVPENCEFIVADLNQGLDFHDGSQDLVQSRYPSVL